MKHQANTIKIPITTSDELKVKEVQDATPAEVKLWKKAIQKELQNIGKEKDVVFYNGEISSEKYIV